MSLRSISVVIPLHNERDNIETLVSELEQQLQRSFVSCGRPCEIILVNDGSTDGTRETLDRRTLKQSSVAIRAVHLYPRQGQSVALGTGFRASTGDIICTLDGDLQNDPKDLPQFAALLDQGAEFVTGWRKERKGDKFKKICPSTLANILIRFLTGTSLHDLGCGIKAYKRKVALDLNLSPGMHRFINPWMERRGFKVAEVQVIDRARVSGQSKYGFARIFQVLLGLVLFYIRLCRASKVKRLPVNNSTS